MIKQMKLGFKSIAMSVLLGGMVCAASSVAAYPERPVKIIVPVAPGGSIDAIARLIADYLRGHLSGTFLVENKAGANTEIGSSFVSQSPPDGYTLLVNTDALVTASLVSSGGRIDPAKSLKAVSMIVSSPAVLVVQPQLGARTIQQFIALAKVKSLNVASTGSGTASQFTGMMFRQNASIDWTDIPYSGSAPAMAGMLGGQVDAMWSMAAPLLAHIKSGRIYAIGVTSAESSPQLPGVPTVSSVLPDFVVNNWTGLFAPPGTPDSVVRVLSRSLAEMMKDPVQAAKLSELGFVPIGSDPIALENEIQSSLQRWRTVLAKQRK